jgi:beta-glucosidase
MKLNRNNKTNGLASLIVVFTLCLQSFISNAQTTDTTPLYLDYTQPVKARVSDLLSRITLEEKLLQMSSRISSPIERLGIPGFLWSSAGDGHCVGVPAGEAATVFPVPIAQAASWDKNIVHKLADIMSDEVRARVNGKVPKATLTFWAPVIEMARDPRWGRTEECYGEDPYLTSQMGLAFVKGLQGDDPRYLKSTAGPKHFALNNEEWDRHNGSSNVDDQLLHEYYLRPYKSMVQEGKVLQIMAAYNRLNEVPCIANKKLLTDILRGEWGYEGNIVSDCNGIRDLYEGHKYVATVQEAIALAINAGMDIECGDCFRDHLSESVKMGLIPMAAIDTAITRILIPRFKLGLYDPQDMVPYTKIPHSVLDSPEHRAVAREAAQKTIVLLKNENQFLPLDLKKTNSIAVIGPIAAVAELGGYTGGHSKAISPLQGIKNKLDSTKVHYVKGTDVKIALPVIPSEYLIPDGGKPGEHGLKGEYFKGVDCSGEPVLTRVDSIIDFKFGKNAPVSGLPATYYSIRWTGEFIAPCSGPYYIGGQFDDAIKLYVNGQLLIDRTLNRNKSSEVAKIEVEKGRRYAIRLEYTQQWYNAEVKLWGAPQNSEKFSEAVNAARNADIAIVVLGTDETVEKEGVDRPDLNLPGDQEDLVKAVFKANPKTIVVLQNGSTISATWLKGNVPALLETWYNGEEGGNALADVLFGDYNPGGRLPLTFYKSSDNFPSFSDYDIRKGRTYMYGNNTKNNAKISEVLYPFGFGLSYTQFSYGKLEIVTKAIDAKGAVKARVRVKNSGSRAGDEVVQLYAHDEKSSVQRPEKQLVCFERIHLQPNETKVVELEFPAKDLAYWNVATNGFIVEPGIFMLMVGRSSAEILSNGKIEVK